MRAENFTDTKRLERNTRKSSIYMILIHFNTSYEIKFPVVLELNVEFNLEWKGFDLNFSKVIRPTKCVQCLGNA